MKVHYCEFIGDKEHYWDEVGYKGRCEHAGFEHCTLHKEPLGVSKEGWRVCGKSCTTPFYTPGEPYAAPPRKNLKG